MICSTMAAMMPNTMKKVDVSSIFERFWFLKYNKKTFKGNKKAATGKGDGQSIAARASCQTTRYKVIDKSCAASLCKPSSMRLRCAGRGLRIPEA